MRGAHVQSEVVQNRGGGYHKRLFDIIISKRNLISAWREFLIGKKKKPDVVIFSDTLEENILSLHERLALRTYVHGGYASFYITDPKLRHIHKASIEDRLLHHAVHRIIAPLFEPGFIFDSYSSRKGKGAHAAFERLRKFAWKVSVNNTHSVWALKCDIRRFFDSIDHVVLLSLVKRKILDQKLISLLERIIHSFEATRGKGLPLGNLTSQLFANVYLDPLDQFVKRTLRIQCYVRYADDFVLLSRNRHELEDALSRIREFLSEKLLLALHPHKVFFRKWHQGIDFLGYVHFPHFRIIRTNTKRRIMRNLMRRRKEYSRGVINEQSFESRKQSYLGVLSHARSKKLERMVKNISSPHASFT